MACIRFRLLGVNSMSRNAKAGQVEQTNFDSRELIRFDAASAEIHTHLLAPTGFGKPLGGVGEP